jgi:serine/threonine-protein kinase
MSATATRLANALADRYRIERELGQGGMATVYLAEDLKHDRKVAIKVLKPELAAVLGAERFVVEIKTTAALSHPHILPLFDSGTADGFLFYVMPYIKGETIREKLNRETQFGVEEAVRIAREVGDALDYAHRNGVIHRDIKPENILLHDGRPMVMDFGIALAVSAAAGGRMTETGLSLGTPHYMSPEQATAEKEITPKSDVYSLASVLYEMLAGQPPHLGGPAQQVIMRIITEPARPVNEFRRNVPGNVVAALAKSLEKLPADRFDNAKAFAEALVNPQFTSSGHATMAHAAQRSRANVMRAVIPWGIAGIAATVAAAFALRGEPAALAPVIRFAITAPGVEISRARALAISNDGKTIVFAGTNAGTTRLYARTLDDPVPRVLVGTEGALGVAISPDSRWVLFSASDNRVKRVALEGGSVENLVRTAEPAGLTWHERLGPVLGMPLMSSRYRGLSTIPPRAESSLTPITLATRDSGRFLMHHEPMALGDGNTIVYSDFGEGKIRLGVFTVDDSATATLELEAAYVAGVAGDIVVYGDRGDNLMAARVDLRARRVFGQPVRIPTGAAGVNFAAMSPTGTLVIQVSPSTYQAVLVDERGAAEPLAPDTVNWLLPRFSPDGRRIVFDGNFRNSTALWLYDAGTSVLSKLNDGKASALRVVGWSADGRRVLNATRSGTRFDLEWIATDAARAPEPVSRVPVSSRVASVTVAPNERAFAIGTAFGSGGFNIMLSRTGSDSSFTPFVATDANEIAPSFSPDGRWVAYASDESGRYEVYAKSYPGPGPRVQISDAGGGEPVWAKDGRRLFYRNGRAMIAAHIERGTRDGTLAVTRREHLFSGVYYGGVNERGASYDVSPDGKRFVMARSLDEDGTQLLVWTGWLDEVRRLLDGQAGRSRP